MKKPHWMVNKCWECFHYQPIANEKQEYVGQGFCKESIPRPIKVGEIEGEATIQLGVQKQKVKKPVIHSYQPVINHDWPACAKFDDMPPEYQLKAPGSDAGGEAQA